MRFITVRDLRLRNREIRETLRTGEEAVLTYNGNPVALLIGIQDSQLEETIRLVRRARTQVAVSRMREHARRAALDRMSGEDIDSEIRAARQERRS